MRLPGETQVAVLQVKISRVEGFDCFESGHLRHTFCVNLEKQAGIDFHESEMYNGINGKSRFFFLLLYAEIE